MSLIFRNSICHLISVAVALSISLVSGCGEAFYVDQSAYDDIDAKLLDSSAFVRVYGATWIVPEFPGMHTWFVYKQTDSQELVRWEVYPLSPTEFGQVRRNGIFGPLDGLGAGVWVLAELNGEEAEEVIEVLETQSPLYPFYDMFSLLFGPNCNTYTQWILDQANWNVELPDLAYGHDFPFVDHY